MDYASGRSFSVSVLVAALVPAALAGCGDEPAGVACSSEGSFDAKQIVGEWEWTGGGSHTLPIVADLDGDGIPEVVVNATTGVAPGVELGEMVLLDGATGEPKWRIAHDPANDRHGSHGMTTSAVADLDGDGRLDIVYAGREDGAQFSFVHAVDPDGKLLWTSHFPDGAKARLRIDLGAFAVANLDEDASAEVVIGAAILDHDGTLVAQIEPLGSTLGSPFYQSGEVKKLLYTGSLASVADLDGDAYPEIVTGRDAWKIDWQAAADGPPTVTLTQLWQDTSGEGNDGYPALADLDANGTPEVVLVAWPDIRVLDGRTGRAWCGVDPSDADCLADPSLRTRPIMIEGGDLGGPATLADFDGDGRIEAGIAGGNAYSVYDFHRPDEEIVVPAGDPQPAPGAAYVRWALPTQDNSSASTGSSVFDLDGDGVLEVLYQDECQLHILDGATGEVRHQMINSSFTTHEYPIVADVDGDGASELLVIANHSADINNTACEAHVPGFTSREGVFLYGSGGRWAAAAPFWTQHGFHITNADAAGHVPLAERAPWDDAATNSVRQAAAASCE